MKNIFIVGETTQSWIIGYEKSPPESKINIKVKKKDMSYKTSTGGTSKLYLSEEEINNVCWIEENKYRIVEKLRKCNDYDKLKKINDLLNN